LAIRARPLAQNTIHVLDLFAATQFIDHIADKPLDHFTNQVAGRELTLLADAVASGTPALGVCLGAQLLAAATGGRVARGHGLEVGWGPVTLTDSASDDALFRDLPASFSVLHWHGDTIELPPDAVLLASNAAYPNQAIRVGPVAWGLQFHLEVDRTSVETFVEAFPGDADAAVSGRSAIRDIADDMLQALDPIATAVLDRFAALVARC